MDKQAKSVFTGIMAAFLCIAVLGGGAYGLYYASQADERKAQKLKDSVRELDCAIERVKAAKAYSQLPIGHPCR